MLSIWTELCESISKDIWVTDLNSSVDARVVGNVVGRMYRIDRRTHGTTDRKLYPYIAPTLRQARRKWVIRNQFLLVLYLIKQSSMFENCKTATIARSYFRIYLYMYVGFLLFCKNNYFLTSTHQMVKGILWCLNWANVILPRLCILFRKYGRNLHIENWGSGIRNKELFPFFLFCN